MRMNNTNYKQYDTRWGSLLYPKKPWYIKNCGCGEVAICNTIIEMDKYASETPKTIQPFCVRYAAPNGDGTYHAGIPLMMQHYGMTEVKEHSTMPALFDEMAKGDRVAILLMGSRLGGSKKVRWTSSGHFIAATGYKKSGTQDMLYIKDSNSSTSARNGWLSYQESLKGDCLRVWSGKITVLSPTSYRPSTPYTGTLPKTTVREGSKGEDAKACQEFLNWCINYGLSVDGNIGSKSVNAIKVFQKTYGLGTDGIFGSKSKSKAKEIIAEHAHKPYDGEYPNPVVKEKVSVDRGKDIAEKAREYAWPSGTKASVYKYSEKSSECGSARPAYKTALKKYMNKSAKISQTDCGYFASTCVRASGVSSDFLCLPKSYKNDYPAVPNTMSIVSKGGVGTLKAGDVIRYRKTKGQHTVVYVGSGQIAHASREHAFPRVASSKPWTNDNVKYSTIQVLRAKPVEKETERAYLKRGDSGEEVKKLQNYINWFFQDKYGKDVLTVDSQFGPATESYAKLMQSELGFTDADGLIGPKTIEAMKAYKR